MNERDTRNEREALNLEEIEKAASAQAEAHRVMLLIGEGVGGLGVRHHADTVLALLARIRELEADRKHPEPEWEYGAQHSQGVTVARSREEAESAVAEFLAREPRLQVHARGQVRLLRRVKAGPWEQVNP